MPRIVALPVDARPVVRSQVVELAACAGWQLQVPPTVMLGHLRQPADRDALMQWLREHVPGADGVVLSLDMLLYGGLVPSRFIEDSLDDLLPRLQFLTTLKALAGRAPLYAFAATMRISNSDVAEEEKAYWSQWGRQIWSWSYHSDKAEQTGDATSCDEARAAALAIPEPVLHDYRNTRARNHALLRQALQAVSDGCIDRLALPQDDTAAFGLNIAERRELQALVTQGGLQDRVLIAPGADEVLHTLTAHLVARLEGHPPLRLLMRCSDPQGLQHLHALYEDRPLRETLADQARAVGARFVDDPQEADLLLAVHSQGHEQGDWAMGKPLPQRPGISVAWWSALRQARQAGLPVALADLAFANGGDPVLLAQAELQPSTLFTYAGWNTAGNRLGGLLAHASLARGCWWESDSRRVLARRLFEDGVYQAQLRAVLRGCSGGALQEAQLAAGELQRHAQTLVPPACNAWAAAVGLPWRVGGVSLPWDRSFEIDLQLEATP